MILSQIRSLSKLFSNKEEYFDALLAEPKPWSFIAKSTLLIFVLTFAYGFLMGIYHSFPQALMAGLKVPVLFFGALLVCFPCFFILQLVLGSRLTLAQMISLILSGFLLIAVIMLSLSPVVVFFILTGGNYHFLQLLHVAIFAFSGIFGLWTVLLGLKYSCEVKGIYPRTGVTVFWVWIVILGFVGIQLAWNLRPFLANKSEPFSFFRKYEGNFYTAVGYSFRQLAPDRNTPTDDELPALVRPMEHIAP
jgi:hypothetical protein